MILRTLKTEPKKLFDDVTFRQGINFIYGYRKETKAKSKEKGSLNNIGKSAFLDLIDFCLAADIKKNALQRLYFAREKGILNGITVFLEFSIGKNTFEISRSFFNPSSMTISENKNKPEIFSLDEMRTKLCDLIFKHDNYKGFYTSEWYRQLLSFYITILKSHKAEYPDPFKFIEHKTDAALLQIHLYLLNINNKLFYTLENLYSDLKKNSAFYKETEDRVCKMYALKNFKEAQIKLTHLNNDLKELKSKILAFRFAKSQQNLADKIDEMTNNINDLYLSNYLDKQKLDSYNQSLNHKLSISTNNVAKLFDESKILFGDTIKKTLNDAVAFKEKLSDSRKEFIQDELDSLEKDIKKRLEEIQLLDEERAILYNKISTANSIQNITDYYNNYELKVRESERIQEQINTHDYYLVEINKLEGQIKTVHQSIYSLRESIKNEEAEMLSFIKSIFQKLYPSEPTDKLFSFVINEKSKTKLKMEILSSNDKWGKARGRARTMIYDLAVLFYSIKNNINSPRFLIHDGIFDGIDKAQFVDLIDLLDQKVKDKIEFQYIVTLNEEGILTKKFGDVGKAAHTRILNEAIIKLTPSEKLFKEKY